MTCNCQFRENAAVLPCHLKEAHEGDHEGLYEGQPVVWPCYPDEVLSPAVQQQAEAVEAQEALNQAQGNVVIMLLVEAIYWRARAAGLTLYADLPPVMRSMLQDLQLPAMSLADSEETIKQLQMRMLFDTPFITVTEAPALNLSYYLHHESESAWVDIAGQDGTGDGLVVELGPVGLAGPSQTEFQTACLAAGWRPEDQFYTLRMLEDVPGGTLCSVCHSPQIPTPSGVSCENGHGGAAGYIPDPNPHPAEGGAHAGFTGTQIGMTAEQFASFQNLITAHAPEVFHHGDCIGADKDAAEYMLSTSSDQTGTPLPYVISHPPDVEAKRAFLSAHEFRDPLPYLQRNHAIVDESSYLIACPKDYVEEQRSGTWATIRYALKTGKPVFVIWPDGQISENFAL